MDGQQMTIDDNYTGELAPGSDPQRRTIAGATITKISVGPMDNNAYLVVCSATGDALLIDAANEADRLARLIEAGAPTLSSIVTTHQHPDHWLALAEVVQLTGVPTVAHALDAATLPVTPDRTVTDGDLVEVGSLALEVIHLAGHTPGSIALALTDPASGTVHLFTGDSLFPGGVGKTPDSDHFDSLYRDVTTKIFERFPDDTVIYPGHGKDTTLGAERPFLAEWQERGW
ncbi:MBL fold metallo-hydrolase [Rhodococcus spelaei]|uniref:MBL fold metallo-hydrolase n=1 Tax=Rhodococcus spelaei TaxID=2546320 RepID=A0A541AZG7_9NOCA|nr:MBL fold metallo-hydrolase [Rhodococcus spelaei]TQF65465.1 MBL fold metallo-hydrolase [Rhodococcus spelaei]